MVGLCDELSIITFDFSYLSSHQSNLAELTAEITRQVLRLRNTWHYPREMEDSGPCNFGFTSGKIDERH